MKTVLIVAAMLGLIAIAGAVGYGLGDRTHQSSSPPTTVAGQSQSSDTVIGTTPPVDATSTTSTPPPTYPSSPRQLARVQFGAQHSASASSGLFVARGVWRVGYRIQADGMLPNSCEMNVRILNADGTSSLPSVVDGGQSRVGSQTFDIPGTYRLSVSLSCSPSSADTDPQSLVTVTATG
jgi:hypothetical protein